MDRIRSSDPGILKARESPGTGGDSGIAGKQTMPELTAAERQGFTIVDHSDDVIGWLGDDPGRYAGLTPIHKRNRRGRPEEIRDVLPTLAELCKTLGVELVMSAEACGAAGGDHTVRKRGVRIGLAPLIYWNDTKAIEGVLPETSAVQHLNGALAHELGHASANGGSPPLWNARKKAAYRNAAVLVSGLAVTITETLVGSPTALLGLCVFTAGMVRLVAPNRAERRSRAGEEVVAEVVGYCIMRSLYDASSKLKQERWAGFGFSRLYFSEKIKHVPVPEREKFYRDLQGEIAARITTLNATIIRAG